MTILLWKFNWPHYDTRGGIKKDAVRLALTLLRLVNALKPKGVLYFSLKLGCQSSFREGKTYYFYQKEWVDTFVQKELMLEKIKIWQNLGKKTSDPVTWDNYLYKKT